MIKLDTKDRKILYYLSMDSRLSYTQLAKKVALSKNSIKYRIERLRKLNIISKYASVVNIGSLNLTTAAVLLKFNEDIYEKEEIINYFKQHGHADWIIVLSGQWDLFVEFIVDNLYAFEDLLKEIQSKFGNLLNTYQVFFSSDILRVEHLIKDFYKDLEVEEVITTQRTKEIHKIDNTDKRILATLNQDSSLPLLEIARKINSSIDIVRYRIKNMINKGVIIKSFAEISLKKLGYTKYLYRIKLKNIDQEKLNKLKSRIKTNNNITYAFFDVVNQSIVFVCAYNLPEEIDHLSRSLRKDFREIIDNQEYLLIKEQVLFNLFPKGLIEKENKDREDKENKEK